MQRTKAQVFQTDQNLNGLILTEKIITEMITKFFSEKKIVPCLNESGETVGKMVSMDYKEDRVIFEMEIDDGNWKRIQPKVEYEVSIKSVKLLE